MPPQTQPNPYSAPVATAREVVDAPGPQVDFGIILRRWERLRLYYNGILVPYVLLLTFGGAPAFALRPEYWFAITLGGALANLCFLTGPAVEGYATYFRVWPRPMTIVLFVAGLIVTMFFALVTVASLTGAF